MSSGRLVAEYNSALFLVDEHNTAEVSDIHEAWSGLLKDSFHKMFKLEQEAFREGFTFAHLSEAWPL